MDLSETVRAFPQSPGVYLMKDLRGKIIYIGKANNLKKRVGSYFSGAKDIKTEFLVKKVRDVDHIVTRNEYEALLLENTLIKKWKPHYNVNLKDGKSYPVIRITNEPYPRVFRTRRIVKDGSIYFGPYPDVKSIDRYLELINKMFPLRKCRGTLRNRYHPCLYYHMHRCSGPCCGNVGEEEYAKTLEQVKLLLSGEIDELIADLAAKMEEASGRLDFEEAARLRDTIDAVKNATGEQEVVDFVEEDRDYIASVYEGTKAVFVVFEMRGGKLTGQNIYRSEVLESREEALTHFILQYYNPGHRPPAVVFVNVSADFAEIEGYLEKELGADVRIAHPEGAKQVSLLTMAEENARLDLLILTSKGAEGETDPGVVELKEILGLEDLPIRIEGFDIAQLAGTNPTASMVAFRNGRPDKSNYRRYKIKTLGGEVDDFKAVREVVARRYTRVMNEGGEPPDLVLIDGGKGQVSSAAGVLEALGLGDVPCVGLAKKFERVIAVGGKELELPEDSPALRLLQWVRDEAHRFATTHQKKLRKKGMESLTLEAVEGVGRKRAAKLLSIFGSMDEIKKSSSEEISRKTGVPAKTAERVLEFLSAESVRGSGGP